MGGSAQDIKIVTINDSTHVWGAKIFRIIFQFVWFFSRNFHLANETIRNENCISTSQQKSSTFYSFCCSFSKRIPTPAWRTWPSRATPLAPTTSTPPRTAMKLFTSRSLSLRLRPRQRWRPLPSRLALSRNGCKESGKICTSTAASWRTVTRTTLWRIAASASSPSTGTSPAQPASDICSTWRPTAAPPRSTAPSSTGEIPTSWSSN